MAATTDTDQTTEAATVGRVCALIPAAGRGVRFGGPANKVFAPLLGRPLLGWTLQAFADCRAINDVILIGSESDLPQLREIGAAFGGGKVRDVVLGGADRQASVRNGLAACPDAEYIVVHDGARPCVFSGLIIETLFAARDFGGSATAAVPVADTLVREDSVTDKQKIYRLTGEEQLYTDYRDIYHVAELITRSGVWAVQTPQVFRADILQQAHKQAEQDGFQGTDDAGLVQRLGGKVVLVRGVNAPKVTLQVDVILNEAILKSWYGSELASPPSPLPEAGRGSLQNERFDESERPVEEKPIQAPPSRFGEGAGGRGQFRIGYGYDVHPFAPASDNRTLFLGGIAFPGHPQGLAGHSDADVLLHALCDALLGAAGMGDIGQLFPPSDNRHKNRASMEFLEEVAARLRAEGWQVANVDMTVIAEAPKINPRVQEMKAKIGVVLNIGPSAVGIKATTSEGLGFVGRGEGIAAHATALLTRS